MPDDDTDIIKLERDRNDSGRPENARPRDRFGAPLPRDAKDQMPGRAEPETTVDTVDDTVARGIELFDEQRFFEAHEFFEWAWKGPMTPDDQRSLFKGLAQICVGYTHTQRGNATGAAALLERGIEHVQPFTPSGHGIDLAAVIRDAGEFLTQLRSLEAGPAEARSPDLASQFQFPSFPLSSD